MDLITKPNFNNEVFTFHLNGKLYTLTNASQHANPIKYKYRETTEETENERFVIIGSGNYAIEDDGLINQIVFIILMKVGTNNFYTLLQDNFTEQFVPDK